MLCISNYTVQTAFTIYFYYLFTMCKGVIIPIYSCIIYNNPFMNFIKFDTFIKHR